MKSSKSFDIRDIALQKTLSREDELAIFTRLGDLRSLDEKTSSEDQEIKQLVEHLVRANIRFVVMVAKNYERKRVLPLEDLIAEGMIGLLQAIDRFDVTTENKFVSYLVWWVRNSIYYALVKGKGTSAHFYNKAAGITKRIDKVEQEAGRKVSLSSVFEDLGLSYDEILAYEGVSSDITSLDELQGTDDGAGEWARSIEDQENEWPSDAMEEDAYNTTIRKAVDKLGHREAYIVKAMMGLLGNKPMTLKEVGLDVGLTHERTRQLYRIGLHNLSKDPSLIGLTEA